jgi:hypothetical protein
MDYCKELVRKAGGTVREDMSRFFGYIAYACVLQLQLYYRLDGLISPEVYFAEWCGKPN